MKEVRFWTLSSFRAFCIFPIALLHLGTAGSGISITEYFLFGTNDSMWKGGCYFKKSKPIALVCALIATALIRSTQLQPRIEKHDSLGPLTSESQMAVGEPA